MATGFEGFDRQIAFATAGIAPENIAKELALFARAELAKAIAAGASPQYERFVNNRPGLPEESVTVPGSILYVFTNWPLVINSVLAELVKRSPRRSGRFASSFIVIANQAVTTNYAAIPADAEVIITNFQPYVRKIEGGKKLGQKRVFDSSKNAVSRRFGAAWRFETRFLNVGAGVHPMMPYILKGDAPLQAAAQNARSSAFRAGRATLARRKDRQAGQPITYPAILINAL
jgi:hypothetical protein